MTSADQLELLASIVDLRITQVDATRTVARELAHVEARLRGLLGDVVRKQVAAQLLGVSRQALDQWVVRGDIAAVDGGPQTSRLGIPTDEVIALAVEIRHLERHRGPLTRPLHHAVAARGDRASRRQALIDADSLIVAAGRIARAAAEQRGVG